MHVKICLTDNQFYIVLAQGILYMTRYIFHARNGQIPGMEIMSAGLVDFMSCVFFFLYIVAQWTSTFNN